jgi:glycine/D-amino acid oxidase-like deaminating enzyme
MSLSCDTKLNKWLYGEYTMKNYAKYSFWLESCGDDLTPRAPLDGTVHVDVAILGAGFSGLWTAYYLSQADPSLKIAIVEADIAGFGASGRNGGWCVAGFPHPTDQLIEKYGTGVTRAIIEQMYMSVDEVGRVSKEEDIPAHYVKPGTLEIARSPHIVPSLHEAYQTFAKLGLEDNYKLLDAYETAEHLRVNKAIGSLWKKHGASVQPAGLARGLARAVERHGVTIYEQTPVRDFEPGPRPRLITDRGDVWSKVIVLAGEAYLSQLPKLKRQIVPATSHMVVTEPISEDIWKEIGWEERGVVTAGGVRGGYLNKTIDGRIAFGPYRGVYPFGSKITDDLDIQPDIFEHGRESTYDWFPLLRLHGVGFTHGWGGVFGMPRDRMPTMSYNPATGIATARGYTGQGVATANLSGRILSDLITGKQTELTELPMTRHQSPDWEPEPIRWAGATFVRKSLQRVERQAEKTGSYPDKPTLAQRLFRR